MGATLLRSTLGWSEWNDAIGGVMTDVGAAAERDPGAGAPVGDYCQFIMPKVWVIGRHVGHSPQAEAGDRTDIGAGGDMEHQAVDLVMLLADFLDQQVDAGKVRLQRRSEQL